MTVRRLLGGLIALSAASVAFAADPNRWCGKYYKQGAPNVPPGGQFVSPSPSSEPRLAFSCAPRYSLYAHDESSADIIVDAPTVFYQGLGVAMPSDGLPKGLDVEVFLNGAGADDTNGTAVSNSSASALGRIHVELGTTGTLVQIPLQALPARTDAYSLSCVAKAPDASNFTVTSDFSLRHLPANPNGDGSTVHMDWLMGTVGVRKGGGGVQWTSLGVPFGFYASYSYLIGNLSLLDEYAATGMNMIHLEPDYGSTSDLDQLFNRTNDLGLWVIYDMRNTYLNLSSVKEQTDYVKSKPNLLMWYTADEPDGQMDPHNATTLSYDAIYARDGFHPISLVLNCKDYFWSAYTSGADVISEDVYPVGLQGDYSNVYHTTVNTTFGCSGCDDCFGYNNLSEHPARLALFESRTFLTGRTRNLTTWSVPQAFGASEYWPRIPTEAEYLTMSVGAITQGATGVMPWFWDGTTPQTMKDAAKTLAGYLAKLEPLLWRSESPSALLSLPGGSGTEGVYAGLWSLSGGSGGGGGDGHVLVLANTLNSSQPYSVSIPGTAGVQTHTTLFDSSDVNGTFKGAEIGPSVRPQQKGKGATVSGRLEGLQVVGYQLQ